MMNYFIYNNINSLDMGIRIQSKDIFSAPKRDIKFKSIGGRSGDLILDNNRYENAEISYTVFVVAKSISELANKLTKIKQWLYSSNSYARLEDSYDNKFYRKAVFHKALNIDEELSKVGIFTINFNCKPFKYDKSGEEEIIVNPDHNVLVNPYFFESRPYIKLVGNGDCTIMLTKSSETRIWNFKNVEEYIEIDSEMMSFYKEHENKNSTVTGDGFPVLFSGESSFIISDTISRLIVIPRWCSL